MREQVARLRGFGTSLLRLTSIRSEENHLIAVAILVGVIAGLGAAAFMHALNGLHGFFFDGIGTTLGALGPSVVLFLPALGGLMVGPLIARFAPEARGHGVPEVMTAVATRGGIIRGRVAVVKILASAITIGSGGSAGQEGPMVQIGAAAASATAQRFRVPARWMRTIVACGAAGGIAAVFNAPIGGALFALEVITGELTPAFGAVILSSVSATVISRLLLGNHPSFAVPRYDLVSSWELVFYGLLGLLAGLTSSFFIRTLYSAEGRFERWKFPPILKPAIGGLLVGVIGRFAPEIFGTGSGAIEAATWGRMAPLLLLALVPLKIIATSLTLGSGGSGGVFGPSMYVGAMLGGAFGWAVHAVAPGFTAGPGAYALVGIGAMVGGTALAPLTAIVLLFEMTDDYRIILPVMEATVLSIVVTRAMVGESIYTLKLRQENIPYYAAAELERAHAGTARQAMRSDVPPVVATSDVATALDRAVRLRAQAMPVVDEHGVLAGAVSLEALAIAAAQDRAITVSTVMTAAESVPPDARLDDLLARIAERDLEALVVVEGGRPLGIVSRRDLMRVYEQVLRRR
jgi:chloride channel protein, CIC family